MKRREFFGRLVAALVGLVWKPAVVVGPPLDMNPFNWQSVPGSIRCLGKPTITMIPAWSPLADPQNWYMSKVGGAERRRT